MNIFTSHIFFIQDYVSTTIYIFLFLYLYIFVGIISRKLSMPGTQFWPLTSASYIQRCRFCPVQATIRTLSMTLSSAASSSGVSTHTDSSVIRDPDHTLEFSPSSGAITNISDKDGRPLISHALILTGPIGWFNEPRPDGFSKQRFDNICFI